MRRLRWGGLLGLALLGLSACATGGGPAAAPSVDVTGNWSGQWVYEDPSAGNGLVSFAMKQTGADVTADVRVVGPTRTSPVRMTGIVSGNELRITGQGSGLLTVKGDETTGTVFGILPARVTLKRQP